MDTIVAQADAIAAPLRAALLDSRQRWRDLVTLVADLAFETDTWGRFVFLHPEPALGWATEALLGTPATLLLTPAGESATRWNPFTPTAAVRGRRAWLKRPDGSAVCLSFCVSPVLDAEGRIVGARGIGQDVTVQDGWDAATAAALRRGEVMDHILWRMRQEVMAPRMMQATLEALAGAVGAEGAAVIDLVGDGTVPGILHQAGGGSVSEVLPGALLLLEQGPGHDHDHDHGHAATREAKPVIACANQTRFGEQTALVLWRQSGGRAWDADDEALASASTTLIQVILEHDSIQREMARQARTDPLTGLLNRHAFLDEIARRIDRQDREGTPSTLIFVDLDHFKQLNDAQGHEAGDACLCIVATLLRATVRPTDLVARLGGDEFALWLDGADEMIAAERAESLRLQTPPALAHFSAGLAQFTPALNNFASAPADFGPNLANLAPALASLAKPDLASLTKNDARIGMSIGIATRWPELGEDIETLMHRADTVMYEVKRAGRGRWRVSQSQRR